MGSVAKKKKTPGMPTELPFSQEAEKGVLGSILIIPKDEKGEILDKLCEDDFLLPPHKVIFTSLRDMHMEGKPIDLITFTEYLESHSVLISVGGASYVTELFTFVPSPRNWLSYVEILKDKSLLRGLIERCVKTVNYSTREGDYFSVEDILSRAQLEIGAMRKWNSEPPKELKDHILDKMERMESGEPDSDVIPTLLTDLDRVSPLRRGDMPIIKAKKKVGKSILALTILENICITSGRTGIYFSLEDRTPKVVDRIMAGISRIPQNLHHVKKLTPQQMKIISESVVKISDSRLIIYDDAFDLSVIVNRSRKAAVDYKDLSVIVVDYAQLIRVEVKKNETREREIATISRALRLLSMETGVPVILISQVNNEGETRESRALEQDCTAAWMLLQEDEDPTFRVLKVEFQRNGESGVLLPLRFFGELGRVENCAVRS